MHITVEPRDQYTILHLRGEFDTFYCPLLQKEVEQLIAAGAVRVVLNLRLVKFINSTALGAIIKASKALAAKKGKLVISRPSSFCKDIIEKVGIDRVVPVFDSDEGAGASLLAGSAQPAQKDGDVPPDDEASVLFAPVDADRVEHFIPDGGRAGKANPVHGHTFGSSWTGVGRMSALDASTLRFTWTGGSTGLTSFEMGQFLAIGTELRVKFRLPLLKKGHLEALAKVVEIEERPDGVKVATSFSAIDDDTRKAVKQYAEDLAFLKKELRQVNER